MNPCRGCGFVGLGLAPYSLDWHIAHEAAHIAANPDLDAVSRNNLASFIDRAAKPPSCARIPCGCPIDSGCTGFHSDGRY